MGKLSATLAEGAPMQGHWCAICAHMETEDAETREEMRAMISDRAWSPSAIVFAWARDLGFVVENTAVDIHRKSARARG